MFSWRKSASVEQDADPYTILGLSPAATIPQIKHAFRALSLRCHPDTASVPTPAQDFRQISAAYHALIDPVRRAAYDATAPTTDSSVWDLLATRTEEWSTHPLRRRVVSSNPFLQHAAAAAAATAAEIFGERRWRGGAGTAWYRRATWTATPASASPGGHHAGPFGRPGASIGRAKGVPVRMVECSFADGGERSDSDWAWLWEAAARRAGGAARRRTPSGGSVVDADACAGYMGLREALRRGGGQNLMAARPLAQPSAAAAWRSANPGSCSDRDF
jgi:hypothetical protein